MANTKDDLLILFADNDTNDITAERLRQFVTDIYSQAVLIDDIVDDYDTPNYNKALSAGRGKYLNDRLLLAEQAIIDLTARIEALENR